MQGYSQAMPTLLANRFRWHRNHNFQNVLTDVEFNDIASNGDIVVAKEILS